MLRRVWEWLCSWFRDKPETLPPAEMTYTERRKHWREKFPYNLTVKRKTLMESGESYRYTRDSGGQIRRKLPKGGKR